MNAPSKQNLEVAFLAFWEATNLEAKRSVIERQSDVLLYDFESREVDIAAVAVDALWERGLDVNQAISLAIHTDLLAQARLYGIGEAFHEAQRSVHAMEHLDPFPAGTARTSSVPARQVMARSSTSCHQYADPHRLDHRPSWLWQ